RRRPLPRCLGGGAQAERRPDLVRLLLLALLGDFRRLVARLLVALLLARFHRLGLGRRVFGRENLAAGGAQVGSLALEAGGGLREIPGVGVAQPPHLPRAGLARPPVAPAPPPVPVVALREPPRRA